jgi:hypothetical protein
LSSHGIPRTLGVPIIALVTVAALAGGAKSGETAAKRGLVVVAPERFHAALAPYLEHKRGRLPVELASLEKALTRPGADDPERLKRFLYEAWRERNAGYALLVGDADVLPVRYMVLDRCTPAAFDYAFYPSDLYYADLAKEDGGFEDWNAKHDDFHARYFGEVRGEKNKNDPINFDSIHYRCEIAVGRWPVSTPEEVALVASKTIGYECALAEGRGARARRAAFVVPGGWVDARALFDQLIKGLPPGWTVEKRYFDSPTPPPDEREVAKLLDEGVGLVCHAGHGSDDCWAGCLSLATLERARNAGTLPVLISAGCSTARFATLPPYEAYTDEAGVEHKGTNAGEVFTAPPPPPAPYQRGPHNPTGLGEQALRHGANGAVAYIGCNTGSQPCGLTLVEGFVQALAATPEPTLGDCWSKAIDHYWEKEHLATLQPNADWYPPSIFFQGMKFMVFGDPTLRLPGRRVYR